MKLINLRKSRILSLLSILLMMLLLSSATSMAAPTEVPKGFELLPDGRWAIEEEMVVDIGNTINELQTRIEILEAEKKVLNEALASEREKVQEIEEEIEDLRLAKKELEERKDERIDNLIEIVDEQNQMIIELNKDIKLERLKWAGGGTLAGAVAGFVAFVLLFN